MKDTGDKGTCVDRADQLVGDGLRVKLSSNRKMLLITGDGCRVSLARNAGLLRVTGDGCRVRIGCNLGYVEYNGDGGRIILGPESLDRDRIKYIGDGGIVEYGQLAKSKDSPDKANSSIRSGTRTQKPRPRKDQNSPGISTGDASIGNRSENA